MKLQNTVRDGWGVSAPIQTGFFIVCSLRYNMSVISKKGIDNCK